MRVAIDWQWKPTDLIGSGQSNLNTLTLVACVPVVPYDLSRDFACRLKLE